MKLIPIDRWAHEGAGFNRTAADTVYKAMSEMDPDTALLYGRILVAEGAKYDMMAHRADLDRDAEMIVSKRIDTLNRYYTRTAVSKARAGQDTALEIQCLLEISKAADPFNFTTQQRQQFAAGQTRGQGGRFVQEHTKITTSDTPPMPQDHAKLLGIPPKGSLSGRDLAHYQQAYGQIQDMLSPFHSKDLNALLHLEVTHGDGTKQTTTHKVPDVGAPPLDGILNPNSRITSAGVSISPNVRSPQAAAFDAMSAATGDGRRGAMAGGYAAGAFDGALNTTRMKEFNQARVNADENEDYSGTTRAFGRVARGSTLLQQSLGEQTPKQLQYALAVANHVGQFGPEAQKAFGPAADRAAYRYRGTERPVDPNLHGALDRIASQGYRGRAFREVVIGGQDQDRGWNPGPVLRYFHRQLPNPDLNELQRKSGVIPPSEGVIIGRDGHPAVQSIGYADDWYLPFNLRHLTALKGGEYIRTRSFGGPTTEDIYTGLLSGAKSLTVVSHNGVFTVNFDDNLRGGRRFNDKAARMVGRYGQLLDAVKSGQVGRAEISPSRMTELRAEASEYEPDEKSQLHIDKLKELKGDERRRPKLSRQERGVAATNWLGSVAAELPTRDGRTMTGPELTDELVASKAKEMFQKEKAEGASYGLAPLTSEAEYRSQIKAKLAGTPEGSVRAVAALMADPDKQLGRLDRAMETAEQVNADKVSPLQLDGRGYADALAALHEQFPYYIGKPIYHPWKGAVGIDALTDQTRDGARDTGYVLPKFNRPQAAQAGYFDTDVNGRGKVQAQSTRYQNFRQGRGVIRDVDGKAKDGSSTAQGGAASGTTPTKPGTVVISDKDLARGADIALLNEMLSKTSFADGAVVGGQQVGGKSIQGEVANTGFPHKDTLGRIYAPGAKQKLEELEPSEFHKLMTTIDNAHDLHNLLGVNDQKLADFRSGGKVQPAKPVPDSLTGMLSGVGKPHAFDGAAYDPQKRVPVKTITDAYSTPLVRRLVDNHELAPIDAPADEFNSKVDALKTKLQASDDDNRRMAGQSMQPSPRDYQMQMRDAEGLLRGTQLRARWEEAERNKPTPPPPPPADRVTVVTDDMLNDMLSRLGNRDPGNSNVIEGSTS